MERQCSRQISNAMENTNANRIRKSQAKMLTRKRKKEVQQLAEVVRLMLFQTIDQIYGRRVYWTRVF